MNLLENNIERKSFVGNLDTVQQHYTKGLYYNKQTYIICQGIRKNTDENHMAEQESKVGY